MYSRFPIGRIYTISIECNGYYLLLLDIISSNSCKYDVCKTKPKMPSKCEKRDGFNNMYVLK